MEKLIRFFKDEEGATAVEYGLMVALIAVVIVAAVTALGTNSDALFNNVADDSWRLKHANWQWRGMRQSFMATHSPPC